MSLFDVICSPWAIMPDKLEAIFAIYERHSSGIRLSEEELVAAVGPFKSERPSIMVDNGVAVIPMQGTIAKRANMFSNISGGTSTEVVRNEFREAIAQSDVHTIVLAIDSPGGTVSGTQELAREIFAARGTKRLVAFTDGMMASAAYWIGAAADEVIISGGTTQVGSIGVVAKHVDRSRQMEMVGVRETEIVAGRFKRVVSSVGPLTESGAAALQDSVDHLYGVFVNDIAEFRGEDPGEVVERMAEGRVFFGQKSIDAGLVDRQASLLQVLANMAAPTKGVVSMGNATATSNAAIEVIDQEVADKMCADAFKEGKKEGFEEGKQAGLKEGQELGAQAERSRLAGIEALALAGHEDLLAALKADPTVTPEAAALKVVKAQQSVQGQQLQSLYQGTEDPLPPSGESSETPAADQGKVEAFIAQEMEKGMSYRKALVLAEKQYPSAFAAARGGKE